MTRPSARGNRLINRNRVPRKWLALVASSALALTVAACGSDPVSAEPGSDKYDTVEPGILRMSYESDNRPSSFTTKDGKPTGLTVEIGEEIARSLDLEPKFVTADFAAMLPNVQNRIDDTASFPVLVTPEREKAVDFTTPIMYGQAQIVSRKDAEIPTVAGTSGKTVAIVQGSALIPIIERLVPDATIKTFPNNAACINALAAGQVDALFSTASTIEALLEQYTELTAGEQITSGANAFPVAKDNPELLSAMNDAIETIMTDGTFTELYEKWIPADVLIPEELLEDYPGLEQRSSAGGGTP